jgi:hypothetical protein
METLKPNEVLLAELGALWDEFLSGREDSEFEDHGKMVEFINGISDKQGNKISQGIKDKYPDYRNYELYHLLVGSTPSIPCEKFDFPGDDSIERFIRSFLKS